MKNEQIGKFIAELRKEKKLTQKDLADKLNITDRAVSKWERGLCLPDIMLFNSIATILDVSIVELLNGKRIKENKDIKDKELIKTFSNIEQSTKEKYNSKINLILLLIAGISILVISYNLIKPLYYIKKTYMTTVESTDLLIDNVSNKMNLIKNDQGIFTDTEYREILNYIDLIEEHNDIKRDNKLYKKDAYTFDEIFDYVKNRYCHLVISDVSLSTMNIYRIIENYDNTKEDKYNNQLTWRITNLIENNKALDSLLLNMYSLNALPDDYAGRNFKLFFWYNYNIYYQVLKDVIEVGEIHE